MCLHSSGVAGLRPPPHESLERPSRSGDVAYGIRRGSHRPRIHVTHSLHLVTAAARTSMLMSSLFSERNRSVSQFSCSQYGGRALRSSIDAALFTAGKRSARHGGPSRGEADARTRRNESRRLRSSSQGVRDGSGNRGEVARRGETGDKDEKKVEERCKHIRVKVRRTPNCSTSARIRLGVGKASGPRILAHGTEDRAAG